MKTLGRAVLLLALGMTTACSKTVTWEEQVPLNTGETIWVKRTGTYTFKSSAGNPLDYGWGQDSRSTIEFTYKGKKYQHTDDAGPILLAIGPDGRPNLIALAEHATWGSRHKYYCVTPYYVQFRPDNTGSNWTWPDQIDPWLYGLSTNLIFGLPPMESSGKKFSPSERAMKNASTTVAFKHYKSIDAGYSAQWCLRRN